MKSINICILLTLIVFTECLSQDIQIKNWRYSKEYLKQSTLPANIRDSILKYEIRQGENIYFLWH